MKPDTDKTRYIALFCREDPPRHHFCCAHDRTCPCHFNGGGEHGEG